MEIVLFIGGLVAGVLVGLTGVGGGALMTPFLIYLGTPPSVAVGTDLVYAAISKSFAGAIHHFRKTIHWQLVFFLALGSLPASVASIYILRFLKSHGYNHEAIITIILGTSLMLTSLVIFARPYLSRRQSDTRPLRFRNLIITAAGVFIGGLTTLSSIGAGALGAATLTLLFPALPMAAVVGTDIAHALLLTTVAGIGHWQMGTVNFSLLLPLLAGSIPGLYLGAMFGTKAPELILQRAVALVLITVGISLVI